ncbi:Hydroxypyruvate isomerase [Granulibacter bethesdensis]|uniref:Hydroxypyruvate isomerase n=1 Tax=Granulibacter bethesdensis TaxID=364410 RepID=A0AAC9K9R1_9PROT|nr:TIM barrel protein [Granulibacter bethesdensis]APH54267.1 Hydroxypyruvate isomerase [Granulibacter bethesdensis]APH61852.1 Hydroxypyruvate isomerase [Granulibacter bethesdensis]
MLSLCANLSFLFTEFDFLERFQQAASANFSAVECLFPYAVPADHIDSVLKKTGLKMVLINAPAGNWDKGERGLAALPDRQDEFRAGFLQALHYARTLNCSFIHCMAGLSETGHDTPAMEQCYVSNLIWAARLAGEANITITIEPISLQTINHYYLKTAEQASKIISLTKMPNIGLQLDLYHLSLTEENMLEQSLQKWLPQTRHIQIADSPGRHEPGTGNILWKEIFSIIRNENYHGWISCEYNPLKSTINGLIWRDNYKV